MTLSDHLRDLRRSRGLSQRALAESIPDGRAPITQAAVSLWEKGRAVPTASTLRALADLYQLDEAAELELHHLAAEAQARRRTGTTEAA